MRTANGEELPVALEIAPGTGPKRRLLLPLRHLEQVPSALQFSRRREPPPRLDFEGMIETESALLISLFSPSLL